MNKILILPVKKKWFDLIKSGEKKFEYRLRNEYWKKRLEGKTFSKVVITLGYPKKEDLEKRIEFEWLGYEEIEITSEEWENIPQEVFSINLTQKRENHQ